MLLLTEPMTANHHPNPTRTCSWPSSGCRQQHLQPHHVLSFPFGSSGWLTATSLPNIAACRVARRPVPSTAANKECRTTRGVGNLSFAAYYLREHTLLNLHSVINICLALLWGQKS